MAQNYEANYCGDQACYYGPAPAFSCTLPKCADPRPNHCGYGDCCGGMPGCRRCQFLHCRCGLCRQCRIYEFISSVSTLKKPPKKKHKRCSYSIYPNVKMRPCPNCAWESCPKHRKQEEPMISEYKAQYYYKRADPPVHQKGNKNQESRKPPPKKYYDISSRPPWMTFFRIEPKGFPDSISADEAKLRELDRMLDLERETFYNDDPPKKRPKWISDFSTSNNPKNVPPSNIASSTVMSKSKEKLDKGNSKTKPAAGEKKKLFQA